MSTHGWENSSVNIANCIRRTVRPVLSLALVICSLPPSTSVGQHVRPTAVWTLTDDLHFAREGHTASLLPDGKVLVAGGYDLASDLPSAEIYDPARETWADAAPMPRARGGHTATVLSDGRVLLVGGYTLAGWLSTCVIYDPVSGTWSPTGDLNEARDTHTAELLHDGRVLVAGGEGSGGPILASTEIYDPATGQWSYTGNLNQPRWFHGSTLLSDGRVMVVGGNDGPNLASIEIYDPESGTWTAARELNQARSRPGVTTLLNGDVFVIGGKAPKHGVLKTSEGFNIRGEEWRWTGMMAYRRGGASAILLPGGQVMVVGGFYNYNYEAYGIQAVEIFDPEERTWSSGGSLGVGRFNHTATALKDGRVLVVGGESYSLARPLASAELGTLEEPQ